MKTTDPIRRQLLVRLALGAAAASLGFLTWRRAEAAAQPLLDPSSAAAKKVHYVEDASRAPAAKGNTCASCGLYQGAYGSTQGGCQLFAGKDVRAGGWCSSYEPQM